MRWGNKKVKQVCVKYVVGSVLRGSFKEDSIQILFCMLFAHSSNIQLQYFQGTPNNGLTRDGF